MSPTLRLLPPALVHPTSTARDWRTHLDAAQVQDELERCAVLRILHNDPRCFDPNLHVARHTITCCARCERSAIQPTWFIRRTSSSDIFSAATLWASKHERTCAFLVDASSRAEQKAQAILRSTAAL